MNTEFNLSDLGYDPFKGPDYVAEEPKKLVYIEPTPIKVLPPISKQPISVMPNHKYTPPPGFVITSDTDIKTEEELEEERKQKIEDAKKELNHIKRTEKCVSMLINNKDISDDARMDLELLVGKQWQSPEGRCLLIDSERSVEEIVGMIKSIYTANINFKTVYHTDDLDKFFNVRKVSTFSFTPPIETDIFKLEPVEEFLYKHSDCNYIKKALENIIKPKNKLEFNRTIKNSKNIIIYYKCKINEGIIYSNTKKDNCEMTELIKWCPEKKYLHQNSSVCCETMLVLITKFGFDDEPDGFSQSELNRRLVDYCGVMDIKTTRWILNKMVEKGMISEPFYGYKRSLRYRVIK